MLFVEHQFRTALIVLSLNHANDCTFVKPCEIGTYRIEETKKAILHENKGSVVDPGSGAFLTPGSGYGMNIPDYIQCCGTGTEPEP